MWLAVLPKERSDGRFDFDQDIIVGRFPKHEIGVASAEGEFRPHTCMRGAEKPRMLLEEFLHGRFQPTQERLKFLKKRVILLPRCSMGVDRMKLQVAQVKLRDGGKQVAFGPGKTNRGSPHGRVEW